MQSNLAISLGHGTLQQLLLINPFKPVMNRSVVIPIKQLENAKQRLSSQLDITQRSGLFRSMVEDVFEVVTSCDHVDQMVVVTSDEQVAVLAQSYGARIIAEPAKPGLIESVNHAAELLHSEGVEVMVFLPGDIPLITIEELSVVIEGFGQANKPEFLIVPSHDLGGSNCIAASPPNCIQYAFGEDSYNRHLALAKDAGIEPVVVKLPGIGLDIDFPEDLERLREITLQENLATHSAKFMFDSLLLPSLNAAEEIGVIS